MLGLSVAGCFAMGCWDVDLLAKLASAWIGFVMLDFAWLGLAGLWLALFGLAWLCFVWLGLVFFLLIDNHALCVWRLWFFAFPLLAVLK